VSGWKGGAMTPFQRELIAYAIIAILVVMTVILCKNNTLQSMSIEAMIDARVEQEFRTRYRDVPQIVIDRGTVYAGDREIVIDEN